MKKHETWRIVHTNFGHVQISNLHGKNEMIENVRVACFLANRLGYSIFLLARSTKIYETTFTTELQEHQI